MKHRFSIFTALILTFIVLGALVSAQNVRIDVKFNVMAADESNYFNWNAGKKVVKDSFDAKSGASVAKSTKDFDVVRFDSEATKKAAIPVGLRGLVLYPVSDYKIAQYDDLIVKEEGKKLVIRYVHRGTAYELVTDDKGKFDVLTGAKFAKGLADNVGGEFVLKPEFVKAGTDGKKMSDLDWTKITLVPDVKDPQATRWYEGKLDFGYKKGVLTVKGALVEKK